MRLAGVVGLPLDDARRGSPLLRGVPFYVTPEALFADNPGINLVVAPDGAHDAQKLAAIMVEQFIHRKQGLEPVEYPHPLLEETLKPTYGVIVYQEQVMA